MREPLPAELLALRRFLEWDVLDIAWSPCSRVATSMGIFEPTRERRIVELLPGDVAGSD